MMVDDGDDLATVADDVAWCGGSGENGVVVRKGR